MNDRFKFRVWSKDSSQYIEKECHSCCLFHNGQLDCYNLKDGDCDCIYDNYPEDDLIIEQCTGLKDKNGKLIYEGDIVYSSLDNGTKKVIFWDKGLASFMAHNPKDKKFTHGIGDGYFIELEFEVIGNIHENPELLEVQDDN